MPELALEDFEPEDALIPWEASSSITSSNLPWIDVTASPYSADPTGVLDATAAIQAALDVVGPHTVYLPEGTYRVGQLLINQYRVVLEGNGSGCILNFVPTANDQICVHVKRDAAAVISLVRLRGFRITSSNSTFRKIGIQITDGSETIVEDVVIGPSGSWIGGAAIAPFTGGGSVGLKIRGREFGTFRNVTSAADFPLWIGTNPNTPAISIDHHNFDGLYLLAQNADGPSVYIEDNVVLTNVVIQNSAFVGGNYGVYWLDTTSVSTSSMFTIRNCRPEQLNGVVGYGIFISKAAILSGLTIANIIAGTGNGIYLRNVGQVTIDNYAYNGVLRALDVTTPTSIEWRNSFAQTGSNVSLGTLIRVNRKGFFGAGYPMAACEYLFPPTATFTDGESILEMGVYHFSETGTLGAGATTPLPTFGGSIKQGRIAIVFHGATKDGSMSVAITATNAFLESTSDATIMALGNTASKFCVHYASAASVVLRNNLAESVTYSFFYFLNQ